MPVPGATSNYLVNTTGGAFVDTTEGGTILGNMTTGTVITKSLGLKDNATMFGGGTLPKLLADGLNANQKALSAGTFAYSVAGKYVIAASSDTISGVSKDNILITGRGSDLNSILQFQHDFGADTTKLIRLNRYAYTGYKTNGGGLFKKRSANLFTQANGHTHQTPTTLTTNNMWDPVAGSTGAHTDSAANPTRAIPGELVMKTDFVTLTVASGGDFFDYKAITGM